MLYYVMLCLTFLLYYVILCYIMLCYVTLCYIMLCYVTLCYIMLYYAILCYTIIYYVMLCYIISQYVIHVASPLQKSPYILNASSSAKYTLYFCLGPSFIRYNIVKWSSWCQCIFKKNQYILNIISQYNMLYYIMLCYVILYHSMLFT